MDKYTKESIDWDSYKEHIWVWYMVDNKSLSDILEILKQDGVAATKQQLEFRLKKWRVFKTIKTQEARWMAKQLDISSSTGEPVIFVKSGKILPESQVAQAVKRHAPPPTFAQKFNTDSNTHFQLSPVDLITCSPGPAGFYAREIEPWGFYSTLPWNRFRCALLDGSVKIQIRGDARTSIPPEHLLPITFASRLPSKTGWEVAKFASNLGRVMPEVYTGEHIRRICAIAQAQVSLTTELLEILIFQLSNNFLNYDEDFDSESMGDFNSKSIMHLMGVFGLDNARTIRFLFEAAADQPTILAVLDKFWEAAYETSSTKIVSIIFTEYVRRYDDNDEFVLGIADVVGRAIYDGNLDLAKVILSGHKSTKVTKALSVNGPYFLALCSAAPDHEFALAMAALLLERHDQLLDIIDGTPTDERATPSVFLQALSNGNIRLARLLVEAGLNLLHHCDDRKRLGVDYESIHDYNARSIIDHRTIFTAAVVPRAMPKTNIRIRRRDYPGNEPFANRAEAEKMTLENYLWISEMLSEIGKLPEWLERAWGSSQSPDPDVVVLAALYGYDAFLQLFMHSPGSLNRGNQKGLWPLSAAALGNNESTCRLLVRLGADPNYVRPSGNNFGDWPTPLLHAVYNNSTQLVEVLLDLGADINHRSNIKHVYICRAFGFHRPRDGVSALALAMSLRHQETASLLVHRGAEIDFFAFDLAVSSGEPALIDLLSTAKFFESLLGSRIFFSENYYAAESDALHTLQTHTIKDDILREAASSGSLSLVSQILATKTSGSNHHSVQNALTCSLKKGFENISRELIRAGAKLSDSDLVTCFRSFTLTSIHEFMASSHHTLFSSIGKTLQESIIEFALLENTPDVVQFALETFPQAYSSRALSAAVLRAAESSFRGSQEPMHELLLRRSNVDSEQLDPYLENTAVAISILLRAPTEVVESLLQRSWPEMPAIYCRDHYEKRPVNIADFYYKILAEVFLARKNPQDISCVKKLHSDDEKLIWRSEWYHVMPILPLTLAIDLRNDRVYSKLMAKGFLADRRTIKAAIEQHTSLDILERVLMSCKEGHNIVRLCDDILHFALECKNNQAMHHLIHNGADMSAMSEWSFRGSKWTGTVLQRAVHECRSTDDRCFVQLLLDAGADINEAPACQGGFTALQAAACNGKLDLARQLVGLGADVNARRAVRAGTTCLEAAARRGRLDMTQFLLDAGATTTGKGQLQYIRAAKIAQQAGHSAVSKILRKHRPWDESDESLFQEDDLPFAYILLHPIEYIAEDIRHLADEICSQDHEAWRCIWPKIHPHEKYGAELDKDVSRTHRSAGLNRPAHMPDDAVVTSNSQLASDLLDEGLSGSCGSETDPFGSQMVVSSSTSNYIMPLHTSFAQIQDDPDFHERISELEDD